MFNKGFWEGSSENRVVLITFSKKLLLWETKIISPLTEKSGIVKFTKIYQIQLKSATDKLDPTEVGRPMSAQPNENNPDR